MKEIRTDISKFEDIPTEVMNLIISELQNNDMTIKDFNEFEDLIEYISEVAYPEESIDSCYITKTYEISLNDEFSLEVEGSSYRKDGGVCEQEMNDYITVIQRVETEIQNNYNWDSFLSDFDIPEKNRLITKLKTIKI